MANAEGYVVPKPGIPKTLGILNVIFGVLLILVGLCSLGGLLAAPAGMEFVEKQVKETQAKAEAQQKAALEAQLKGLEEREKAATTDEEKKAIQSERDAANAAVTPPPPAPDMSALTGVLKDPVVMGVSYLSLGTGVVLHLMLLVAGIGLIRLTPWGRSLSVAWAGLQIAQLVILTALNFVYVMPITQANNEKMFAKMEADAKAPGGAPGAAESARMARAMSGSGMAAASAAGSLIFGSIYPIVVLILLSRPGARAACQGAKPSGPADF